MKTLVKKRVQHCYWKLDVNCATTTLAILGEVFDVELHPQVMASAVGMHGAGTYGAQCGLVEGTILFIGILGRTLDRDDEEIAKGCYAFAAAFEKRFSSLRCSVLRPEGFNDNHPLHLCEPFTCEAIEFNVEFVGRWRDRGSRGKH